MESSDGRILFRRWSDFQASGALRRSTCCVRAANPEYSDAVVVGLTDSVPRVFALLALTSSYEVGKSQAFRVILAKSYLVALS
jgi:hypothetical protein